MSRPGVGATAGAILLMVALSCAGQPGGQRKEAKMADDLGRQVQAKDYQALETARRTGAFGIPVLIEAMQSRDAEVRELAVMCLNEVGGPAVAQPLARALDDPFFNIPNRAATYLLQHHSPEILPQLYRHLDGHPEEGVRVRVAKAIGAIGDASAIPELESRAKVGDPPAVDRGIRLALSRLGVQPYLNAFLEELRSPDWKVRLQALRDFEYVHRPEHSVWVVPLLDDRTVVADLGPPPKVELVRMCDVAVNVLARMIRLPVSFDGRKEGAFTDAQLQELKAAIYSRMRR